MMITMCKHAKSDCSGLLRKIVCSRMKNNSPLIAESVFASSWWIHSYMPCQRHANIRRVYVTCIIECVRITNGHTRMYNLRDTNFSSTCSEPVCMLWTRRIKCEPNFSEPQRTFFCIYAYALQLNWAYPLSYRKRSLNYVKVPYTSSPRWKHACVHAYCITCALNTDAPLHESCVPSLEYKLGWLCSTLSA